MHNIIEVSTFGAAVSVPDDGVDFRTAASLYPSLQELTNRTRALYEFLAELTGTIALPGNLSVAGGANVHGTLTASGAFNCVGTATFTALAHCAGGLSVAGNASADSFSCGAVSITSGTSAFNVVTCASLTASGTINTFNFSAGGTSVFGGSVTLAAGATTQGIISYSGNARNVRPMVVDPAGSTISPQSATDYMWRSGTPGPYTISSVGVQDGDELNLRNATSTPISIYQANGTTLLVTIPVISGTVPGQVRVKYSATLGFWV